MGKFITDKTFFGNRTDAGQTAVRRAAAAAASTRDRSDADRRSQFRFLALVAAVVIAGTLVVGFTWSERQYDHPTVLDSWQNAYGVFDCTIEGWLEPFDSRANPEGIRSRGDGMIYIEPASEAVAGDHATLGVFLNAVGVTLTDEAMTLPNGDTLTESGTFCRNEEAFLQVIRWNDIDADTPSEIVYDDLADIVFKEDLQTIAIALAPAGAAVPVPPTAADLPEPQTPQLLVAE